MARPASRHYRSLPYHPPGIPGRIRRARSLSAPDASLSSWMRRDATDAALAPFGKADP